ncbi:unnamed protein product [Arabis nemorensis]|uniref:RING-type domain-containing protein n=1 Tax=Arabis nemorensis TaxID=586526 RepID=A0A565BGD4_9BRAS|nr:unnamed protein product [Arabis nemorensis]
MSSTSPQTKHRDSDNKNEWDDDVTCMTSASELFSTRRSRLDRRQGLNTNSTDLEIESNNFGNINGSDRLPGSVLLARARLFERLRGVSLSSNSRASRVSLGDDQMESSGVRFSFSADPNYQPEVSYDLNKKPQGLTQGAINCLNRQTFSSAKVETEMRDCSICLESFTKGDILITLPCTHSFHSSCLNPWLKACGDCPYCRRAIAESIETCK